MTDQFSDNDLQALWDTQPDGLTIPNMKELTMSLQQEHRQERKRLLLLNVQELAELSNKSQPTRPAVRSNVRYRRCSIEPGSIAMWPGGMYCQLPQPWSSY